MARRFGWALMLVLGSLVAAYTVLAIFVPGARSPVAQAHVPARSVFLFAHFIGGAIAMVAGALQHNGRLRNRYLGMHRRLGQVYVVAVVGGGIGGLAMAFNSTGGVVTHFGFGLLAVLWVGSTIAAWRAIRARQQAAHQAWMIRSYALTLAAVTLRIYIPIFAAFGVGEDPAYQVISWLCWVPNLIVAEWFLLSRLKSMPLRAAA